MEATFSFDPVCEWSWRAPRWLVRVAGPRDLALLRTPVVFEVKRGRTTGVG